MRTDHDPLTLRLFLAICEEGSVVRGAERESTVPSAVSKRMAALEDRVGLRLLRRGSRGMEPTEAGQAFAGLAREVLAGMDRLQATMTDIAGGGEGRVRILASLAALSSHLPIDLVRVLRHHSAIKITLREAPSSEMVRQVREGAADLAICWDAADLAGLQTLSYRSDHACAIVPRGHALARRGSVNLAGGAAVRRGAQSAVDRGSAQLKNSNRMWTRPQGRERPVPVIPSKSWGSIDQQIVL